MASIFKQKYTKKDSNGNTIQKHTNCWYIEYTDSQGIRQRVKGFKDKTATRQLADKLERKTELEQVGIVDVYAEYRNRPLREHLSDFEQTLFAKGNTAKHVKHTINSIKRVIEDCKFMLWSDIVSSTVQRYLAEQRKGGKNISARTFNFNLKAFKQFCKWMVIDHRASESPVEHIQGLNNQIDKRHIRRAFEPDEMRRLLEATRIANKRFGMSGLQRAMLYRLAVETGLRASELKSLTVSSFNLNNCNVTIQAAYSKNRHQDVLPLRPDTAAELKVFLTDRVPKVQVFKVPDKTAKMLRADLAEAGIEYVDDSGRYADFHSLRHTTGSWLAATGVHPKVAQVIMRHSDINLTMSRYTHTLLGQETEAVKRLPDLSFPSQNNQKAIATGTEDRLMNSDIFVTERLTGKLTGNSDFSCNRLSLNDIDKSERIARNREDDGIYKSLQLDTLDTRKDLLSTPDIGSNSNGRCRNRTCDPLIKNQLLYQLS